MSSHFPNLLQVADVSPLPQIPHSFYILNYLTKKNSIKLCAEIYSFWINAYERIALKLYLYHHLNTHTRTTSSLKGLWHLFHSAAVLPCRRWDFLLCFCTKHRTVRDRNGLALDWGRGKLTVFPASSWNHLWWTLPIHISTRDPTSVLYSTASISGNASPDIPEDYWSIFPGP